MMPSLSAGIALWRRRASSTEVLLGHLGGPFWAKKDDGAWSIPKGLVEEGEEPIDAARREFVEELGVPLPPGELALLGEFRQSSKKIVIAWSLEVGDAGLDLSGFAPGTFDMEWPPRSGTMQSFPEIDRVDWFDLETARRKVAKGATPLIDILASRTVPGS